MVPVCHFLVPSIYSLFPKTLTLPREKLFLPFCGQFWGKGNQGILPSLYRSQKDPWRSFQQMPRSRAKRWAPALSTCSWNVPRHCHFRKSKARMEQTFEIQSFLRQHLSQAVRGFWLLLDLTVLSLDLPFPLNQQASPLSTNPFPFHISQAESVSVTEHHLPKSVLSSSRQPSGRSDTWRCHHSNRAEPPHLKWPWGAVYATQQHVTL